MQWVGLCNGVDLSMGERERERERERKLGLERKKKLVVEKEKRVLGLHLNEPIFLGKKILGFIRLFVVIQAK